MDNWAYYTPDGVSDYLPELCGKKREIEQRLRDVFSCSGFLELESSGLEFYDAYTSKRSSSRFKMSEVVYWSCAMTGRYRWRGLRQPCSNISQGRYASPI